MAQDALSVQNGTGVVVRQAFNTAMQASATNQSGSSAPSTTYPFQFFADTNTNTLKLRNAANNAYINVSAVGQIGAANLGLLPAAGGTISGNLIVSGNLTVNGSTTTIDSTTLTVEDKNIELGKVSSPSDTTADGGGITLLGSTNHTFNWLNATDSWTSSEHIALPDNKKLQLGDSQDLTIHHDGSNSYVNNTGTGLLILQGNGSQAVSIRAVDGETGIAVEPNGAVKLFHDNSKKAETSATGFDVTGDITATGNLTIDTNTLHVDSSNNRVGIGVANPAAQLEVKNTGNVKIYADSSGGYIQQDVSNLDALHLISSGQIKYQSDPENDTSSTAHIFECDGSEKFRIDASGNLGIGVSNPTNQFHLLDNTNANDTPEVKIESFRPTIRLKDRSTSSVSAEIVGDNGLLFRVSTPVDDNTALIERMRLTPAGNVLIGMTSGSTTTQGMMFRPGNESSIFRTSGINLLIGGGQSGQKLVEFRHNGTAIGNISKNGTTEVLYNTSNSDRTLKKNFEDWTDSYWTGFKNLKPQKFNYLFQEDSEPKLKGYIAQDLASIFPEAYPKDVETDKYMFNPSGMVTYLMKTLQEAIIKIETLETKVAALEAV